MLESILNQAQGYLLVYSITSLTTLERAPEFVELVKRVNDGELPPTTLVGNKCDLEITREVTKADGKAMADRLHLEWEEASAKNRINSDEIFYNLLRRVIENSKAQQAAASKAPKKRCVIL
jgi:GTPase KRas protein